MRKIEQLTEDDIRAMIDDAEFAPIALAPLRPIIPLFAARPRTPMSSSRPAKPAIPTTRHPRHCAGGDGSVCAGSSGRQYHLFDYYGAPDAERVIILMGSGVRDRPRNGAVSGRAGRKGGRGHRPTLPALLRGTICWQPCRHRARVAVLDRTKEPGAVGEPLYQDVVTALSEHGPVVRPLYGPARIVGGRYGLACKEFTPAMVKAVLDELAAPCPRNHFHP